MKHRSFTVSMEMFRMEVGVFVDYKDLIKYVKGTLGIKDLSKADFDPCEGEAGILLDKKDVPYFYMLLPENPRIGLVAHECSHMADYICDTVGIPISMKATEVRAYMVDYLTQSIVDEIQQQDREK